MKNEPQIAATVAARPLALAMTQLCKVVSKRGYVPILKNVLLRVEDGVVHITATDIDTFLTARIPCGPAEDFATTVDAYQLRDIAKAAKGCVTLSYEAGTLTIASNNASRRMDGLPVGDFPAQPAPVLGEAQSMPLAEFRASMVKVAPAMSKDERRRYLMGVYFYGAGKVVATDGHRLVHVDCQLAKAVDGDAFKGAIVASDVVKIFAGLPKAGLTGDCVAAFDDVRARFIYSVAGVDYSLTTKLVDASYPDFQRVIPQHNNIRIAFDRAQFMSALRAMWPTLRESRYKARLEFKGPLCTLSTSNLDASASSDLDRDSDSLLNFEIGFNAVYLMDALKVMAGDKVTLKLASATDPALFVDDAAPDSEFVIMPYRL